MNSTKNVIGYKLREIGDYNVAMRYFVDVYRFYEHSTDTVAIISSLHEIGYSFVDAKNYRQAIPYFEKSSNLAIGFGDKLLMQTN